MHDSLHKGNDEVASIYRIEIMDDAGTVPQSNPICIGRSRNELNELLP